MTVPVKGRASSEVRLFRWKKNRAATDPVVLRPKIEFTGVRYVATLHQRPHVGANALTWF
jgi:hypothetical protein